MASSIKHHILLLGGHGKVSMLMTPLLLARGWDVTSVIRDPGQEGDIRAAGDKPQGAGQGPRGKLTVKVESLDDVKDEAKATGVLEAVGADWVVWSAGAGGKGGSERTYAIDNVAAKCYISASTSLPQVTKFLMISAIPSRQKRAPWWDDDGWAVVTKMKTEILPVYCKAKLEADEHLTAMAEGRRRKGGVFQEIVLRPGGLSDEPATGKVCLGKTKPKGMVTRGDVAEVAARLLEAEGARGWFDLLSGNEDVKSAVERVVRDGVDSIEGEDVGKIFERIP
ncbi:MAG: hypothetical protein M4579_001648 [Chaenotheca gracillima]|nr:MAG: hypothetical protein M4579_001648 [Chaenotheca gracillima]